jgi:hypothetical protein
MLKRLQRIYKAHECSDIQDIENAMRSVFELIEQYGAKYKLLIRLGSLQRRKEKLILIKQ